ncbi:putative WRKY transcription factor 70 [Abeliophyllum distichum]|uniref:WRKY transcription factor 70 n=1 Tax=Abeliophyllum distichum TaxID=126358 RepID=A0ABD1VRM3_9LAMI
MSSLNNEDLLTKRKSVIGELVRGKESATQLKTLLQNPVNDHASVLAEELAVKIFRSFTQILSVLSYGGGADKRSQIAVGDHGGSACSGENKKSPRVKDRRGCYNRRKTSDSWTTVSPMKEDGCAWRKYGQKIILSAKYPRYKLRAPLTNVIDTDPPESNLLCFEEKIPQVDAPVEFKEDRVQSDKKSSADSSLWHDMKSLEPSMVWPPKMRCFDMEGVDEFGDLDFTFH